VPWPRLEEEVEPMLLMQPLTEDQEVVVSLGACGDVGRAVGVARGAGSAIGRGWGIALGAIGRKTRSTSRG